MATILKTNPRSWKVPFLFIRSLPFPQHGPIELGINFGHIWAKTQAVLIPTKSVSEHILDDVDLAGPLVFAFGFGMLLLMVGLYHTHSDLKSIGFVLAFLCVAWSTQAATRFFDKYLHMQEQRWLIAYPTAMVYTCFVLITVF
ncbi:hypothetical protein B5M09_004497 [Aphanomyces astaci]|uniref:Protein YIPF n=1 Tax=Aphanomyces astaci TaxID=112090 RepID=A0A3R7X3W0_APHAT|nr:hypothetical protein B5M09_004497 [Aphanomyces astaci]